MRCSRRQPALRAVVRAVAEAHGGRVWATSEGPDKGSAFTLALPTRPAESPSPSRLLSPERPPRLERGFSQALDKCLLSLEEEQATMEAGRVRKCQLILNHP